MTALKNASGVQTKAAGRLIPEVSLTFKHAAARQRFNKTGNYGGVSPVQGLK